MTKTFRLDDDLRAKLKHAARLSGVSESEFIRAAIAERSEVMLAGHFESRLGGSVGAVRSKRGHAAQAHHRYRELLKTRQGKRSDL